MQGCAVLNCKNYKEKTGGSISKKTRIFRKKWIFLCARNDKFNQKMVRICSEHFTDDDYERDLHVEFMGEERRKLLKPEAFPNKNLPNRKETVTIDCTRSARLQCRSIKRKLVDELITTKPKQLRSSDNETVSQEKYQISETERITANTEVAPPLNFKPDLHFQEEIELLKFLRPETKMSYEILKSQLLTLKFTHKRCKASVRHELRKILGNIFTPKQTEKLLNKGKRQVWWED
ncbi:hypothetical protein PR048_031389 [Dryococelus australis]|uniref:THAP-type domain-containing protein n=1 Tax=Dryococelus australis TaxID=614101 RepID=A0ABQ9G676_9NEOP|nr:hypothetical protein PR048_031389 [Dryococelus australis]